MIRGSFVFIWKFVSFLLHPHHKEIRFEVTFYYTHHVFVLFFIENLTKMGFPLD